PPDVALVRTDSPRSNALLDSPRMSGPTTPRRARRMALLIAVMAVITLAATIAVVWQITRSDEPPAPTATPPIPTDLAPDAVTDPPFPSLTYGIHTFLWWDETARTFDLDMVKLMNFTHVKQRFAWLDIEPAPGEWHWEQADAVVDEVEN